MDSALLGVAVTLSAAASPEAARATIEGDTINLNETSAR